VLEPGTATPQEVRTPQGLQAVQQLQAAQDLETFVLTWHRHRAAVLQ
jgi:hypothetical protein